MSERGSFVTEYIYCPRCLAKMEALLCCHDKYLHGVVIPSWDPRDRDPLPIIAGKVGCMTPGEEYFNIVEALTPATAPCHPVRLAVHLECGDTLLLLLTPDGDYEEWRWHDLPTLPHEESRDA
jgi:hypothetical protein